MTKVRTRLRAHWNKLPSKPRRIGSREMLVPLAAWTLWVSLNLVPVRAHAQAAGGSLSGTVTNESGAAMPNVQVSLKDRAAGATRVVTTDIAGFYTAPDLPPASYEMTVSKGGFTTQVWTSITVAVGAERVLNVVLHAGRPENVVRMAAPVAPVSQASSAVGGNVNSSTVRDTPLNGRDWAQLATLQAGVTGVQNGSATGGGNTDRGFGAAVSISGARPDQNSYRLDGISINDYSNGAPGSVLGDNLGIDAVEQVSVLGSNYPAEYGRTSGGVINAVTRSGTKSFHGDVYEFFRNSALDARNFFDGKIPPFKRNQFGASAGAPIQKDRMFIFGDYEGLRQSLGVTTVDTVPSPAARAGNLSTGTMTVDPNVLRFINAFYPLPNGALLGNGDTGIFSFAGQEVTNENYFTVKVDRKFSDRDTLSATYMRDNSETVQPDNFNELLSNTVSRRQVVTLRAEHLFSATFLNAARLGFSRSLGITGGLTKILNQNMLDPSFAFVPGGLAGEVRSVPGVTNFSGAPTAGGALLSEKSLAWNSFQGGDDVFLTRGIHSIKFGVIVERMQDNQLSLPAVNGRFRFDSLQNFLTNRPLVFQGASNPYVPDVGLRQTVFGAYVQDDVRLQKNLTVNLGLRYEMATVPTEAHNRISNLRHLTDAVPRVGVPFFSNPTLRNFEPRIGFGWNPRAGKTLLRGGFGIFDVLPLPYEFTSSFQLAEPFVSSVFANTLQPGMFPTGAFQAFGNQTNFGLGSFYEFHPKRNYVMQWNLGIARELTSTLSLTIGYLGSRGVHLPYRVEIGRA